MPVRAQLPDGRILEFPDGTSPAVVQATVKKVLGAQAPPEESTTSQPVQSQGLGQDLLDTGKGLMETGKAIGGGMLGAIYGGYAGLSELVQGEGIDAAVKRLNEARESLSFQPETEEGKKQMQLVGQSLETLTGMGNFAAGGTAGLASLAMTPSQGIEGAQADVNAIREQGLGKALGQETLDVTGSPLAATAAELIPTVGEMALSKGYANRGINKLDPSSKPTPEQQLVNTGQELDVPVLTSDVFQPKSWMGRFSQKLSEKLGPLGSGESRRVQQLSRQNLVESVASEFNVSMDSPFLAEIIASMTTKNAKKLQLGNARRTRAIDKLNEFGDVNAASTADAAIDIVQAQNKLKDRANQSIITEATQYSNASKGQDFGTLAKLRTQIIKDIKDLESGTSEGRTTRLESLNKIKSGMDKDLRAFAANNDRAAAADWVKSTRDLAEQLTLVKGSELRRILNKGEATPEIVLPIIRGGKPSELKRLNESLGPNGRAAARAAVIKDALERSGFFSGNVNPNRFATELAKPNSQKAVNAFFDAGQKNQLRAMQRLLDATRRAQDAPVVMETGASLIPFAASGAVGAGLTQSPLITLGVTGTLSAIAKTYESKAFRGILLKLNKTKRDSPEERRILAYLLPGGAVGLQDAIAQQERKQ